MKHVALLLCAVTLLAVAPAQSVAWRFHTKQPIVSSPTVANGVVYFGGGDGKIYAIDAGSGSQRWSFQTHGAVNSTPAVAGGLVVAPSLDGFVYALDATNGKERWHFKTGGERRFTAPGIHGLMPRHEMMPDPFDVFLSSPAIAGGIVYVGSGDRNVYAIDAATGALKWKFETGNVVHAAPAVANGIVYVGSWDRFFYALDAQTGAVKWKYATGDDTEIYNQVGIQGGATVANGIVYVGCRDSHLYALDAATGALKWTHDEHGSWVISKPAVKDGTVYYTTSDEKTFFALDAATGKERFKTKYKQFAFSSPTIAGNVAYFGTFDGRLYGVDVRDGKIVTVFKTDHSPGDIDLEKIYTGGPTLDGTIVGLSRLYALGAIAATPAIADGAIYITSGDGTLYALRR